MPAARKQVKSIVVTFEDGTTYALSPEALHGPKSGALFWGDHAVRQVLTAFYQANPRLPTKPADVIKAWDTAGPSGYQPSCLVKIDCTIKGAP